MVFNCVVPNCPGEGYIKRTLPISDKEMYRIYLERIQNEILTNLDPKIVYERYRICDRHFEDCCRIKGEKELKRDSLPTLHLPPGFQRTSEADALLYTLQKQQEATGTNNFFLSVAEEDDNSNALENLSKEELIEKVRILQAHNKQLKNIISKQTQKQKAKNNSQKPFDFRWDYNGYAVQEDTDNTIENHIFKALTKTCLIEERQLSNYHRCGRTDKGVSAFGQTISIDVRSKLLKENQHKLEEEMDYCGVLNRVLPADIQCVAWCPVEANYSARFNCCARTYRYLFPRGYLCIEKMKMAADLLIGRHDFRNFCKMDVANGVLEFTRKIDAVDIVPLNPNDNETEYSMYVAIITGSGFLWHQIRCIMGVLFLIGQDREQPDVIKELLDVNKNPCKPDYNLASEIPLNLFACEYDIECQWRYNVDNLKAVLRKLKGMWSLHSAKTTMIKSMLFELETLCDKSEDHTLTECLMQGSKSRKYIPLMQRQKCESLESRIKHYSKKRKLHLPEST